mgnify:CR=1 FL=1
MKNNRLLTKAGVIFSIALLILGSSCSKEKPKEEEKKFNIPEAYLQEAENIPPFWIASINEVDEYLKKNIRKGTYETIGTSAGGRPIQAVFYGRPRQGGGTTTYSGAVSIGNLEAYRGPDHENTVYLGLGGVHGIELEGIMGTINLISVFETGKDLNGQEWPEIVSMLDSIDRIVLVPLVNPDGRARLPIRMESHKGYGGDAYLAHEYLNTGGRDGGKLIGWPNVKEYIPMDFSMFEFPGGYPNDNGVNIMHDNFLGKVQPETQMLYDLTEKEKPDLVMNMHTGVPMDNYFMQVLLPNCEIGLVPVWRDLYTSIHTKLTEEKLKKTEDLAIETDGKDANGIAGFNLNSALNSHCGALCVTVENTSHGYSGMYDNGDPVLRTPQDILRSELVAHQEAMKFLFRTGGRSQWDKLYGK